MRKKKICRWSVIWSQYVTKKTTTTTTTDIPNEEKNFALRKWLFMSCHLFLFIYVFFSPWWWTKRKGRRKKEKKSSEMHSLMHTKSMQPPFDNSDCQVAAAIAPIVRGKNNSSVQVSYLLPTFCVQWAAFLYVVAFFCFLSLSGFLCCCFSCWMKFIQRPTFRSHFVINSFIIHRCCFIANDMNGLKMGAQLCRLFICYRWLHIAKHFQGKDRNKSGSVCRFNGMHVYKQKSQYKWVWIESSQLWACSQCLHEVVERLWIWEICCGLCLYYMQRVQTWTHTHHFLMEWEESVRLIVIVRMKEIDEDSGRLSCADINNTFTCQHSIVPHPKDKRCIFIFALT